MRQDQWCTALRGRLGFTGVARCGLRNEHVVTHLDVLRLCLHRHLHRHVGALGCLVAHCCGVCCVIAVGRTRRVLDSKDRSRRVTEIALTGQWPAGSHHGAHGAGAQIALTPDAHPEDGTVLAAFRLVCAEPLPDVIMLKGVSSILPDCWVKVLVTQLVSVPRVPVPTLVVCGQS